MSATPELTDIVARVQSALAGTPARYALIGALAVGARGYVRATADVDLLLEIPQIHAPRLLQRLIDAGFELDLEEALRRISQRHPLRVQRANVVVDFIPVLLPFFHEVLQGATIEDFAGIPLPIARTEDLIVLKLLAYRLQDQADIAGLLAAASHLDVAYISDRASGLLPVGDRRIDDFRRQAGNLLGPGP